LKAGASTSLSLTNDFSQPDIDCYQHDSDFATNNGLCFTATRVSPSGVEDKYFTRIKWGASTSLSLTTTSLSLT